MNDTISDGEPASTRLTILLVEDHEDSRMVLRTILQRQGHTVLEAENLQNALEIVKTNQIDLLISDIALPDGTGVDLMRSIRRDSSTPGIAISAYGSERDQERSLQAGFMAHLVKPLNIPKLHSTIEQAMKGRLRQE